MATFPTRLLDDLARQDGTSYILLTEGLYPNIWSGLREKVMERAEQLLTPEGRAAPLPETRAIAVDATEEGYANIRQFLIDNNWDFNRDAAYPDFDLIAPMSQLPGVLGVREMPEVRLVPMNESAHPATSMDMPASRVQSPPFSIGDGVVVHGVKAWHDAGFDGAGITIGIIDEGLKTTTPRGLKDVSPPSALVGCAVIVPRRDIRPASPPIDEKVTLTMAIVDSQGG